MELKETILKIASKLEKFKTSDVVKALDGKYTRQYISALLRQMVQEGVLVKNGTTIDARYALPKYANTLKSVFRRKFKNKGLKEHELFHSLESSTPILAKLPENVYSIVTYAFSEMVNNAIEHSRSKYIEIEFARDHKEVSFVVRDFGIGVYRSVMKKRHLRTPLEALQDLLKGKTTTAPKAHSGEGIFFTSKVGDIFLLESYGHRLRVDNGIHDIFVESPQQKLRGTQVVFQITTGSKRHLNTVFRKFHTDQQETAFDKTEIKIKLFTMGTIYVSRSQARRVLASLEKFKSIVLDFDQVPTVGQAFADEIFRVFQQRHPKITIQAINAVEPVQFMIERVERPKSIKQV